MQAVGLHLADLTFDGKLDLTYTTQGMSGGGIDKGTTTTLAGNGDGTFTGKNFQVIK